MHYAGAETSELPSFMEGAVRAGERAAAEVLASELTVLDPPAPFPVCSLCGPQASRLTAWRRRRYRSSCVCWPSRPAHAAGVAVVKIRSWGGHGSGAGRVNDPIAAAVGPGGLIYVTDALNDRVDEFSASGRFIRAWGFGVRDGSAAFQKCTSTCQAGIAGTGDGQFDVPYGIAVGQSGDVYVTLTRNNDRVERFSNTGTFIGKWGTPGSAGGQLSQPLGVAITPLGAVLVVDEANERMQRFLASGTFRLMWGWGVASGFPSPEQCTARRGNCDAGIAGAGNGQFDGPDSIASKRSGRAFVSENGNHRVDKFDRPRTLGAFGGRLLRNPKGIAVDTAGRIVVADSGHNRIVQFSAMGVFLAKWGGLQLRDPEGVAAAPGNRLIVVDTGHNRIVKYAQTG